MVKKEPKTVRGKERKFETGNGRKSTAGEKFAKDDKRVAKSVRNN
jgi:hypothetical protein